MCDPVLITPPGPPFTAATAKEHTRIDQDADDALVDRMILAAVAHLDGWSGILGRAIMPQTWEVALDAFPAAGWRMPLGPVVSVAAIEYDDVAGDVQTVPAENYLVSGDRLAPVDPWPVTSGTLGCVRVRWVAGTGCDAATAAVLYILTTHFYDHRDGLTPPPDLRWLTAPLRRVGL